MEWVRDLVRERRNLYAATRINKKMRYLSPSAWCKLASLLLFFLICCYIKQTSTFTHALTWVDTYTTGRLASQPHPIPVRGNVLEIKRRWTAGKTTRASDSWAPKQIPYSRPFLFLNTPLSVDRRKRYPSNIFCRADAQRRQMSHEINTDLVLVYCFPNCV